MVNILVPTDFSSLSKVAIQYAVKMANLVNGNVTLLHVIANVVEPTRKDALSQRIKVVEKELLAAAEEGFVPVLKEAEKFNKTSNPIVCKIQMGRSFSETVKQFAKKNKSGLIVMGTRGASGVAKYVLGSNTVSVLDGSHIPVLAIPENAEFKTLKNVAYACDLKHVEKEVKAMLPFLKIFDSTLHVFHLADNGKNLETKKTKINDILKKLNYRKSTVTVQSGKDVKTAIDNFVQQVKVDMLSMFPHEQSFYGKLFGKSITKKMAFHSSVPLLAFKSK
jgi:nucleotide-binding universal stress UspA family protein